MTPTPPTFVRCLSCYGCGKITDLGQSPGSCGDCAGKGHRTIAPPKKEEKKKDG